MNQTSKLIYEMEKASQNDEDWQRFMQKFRKYAVSIAKKYRKMELALLFYADGDHITEDWIFDGEDERPVDAIGDRGEKATEALSFDPLA